MNRNKFKNYLAIGLLVGVIGITILQILNANSTTKTESALFNILQFIFSVGFSWVIREFNFEVRHSPMPPDGTLRIP